MPSVILYVQNGIHRFAYVPNDIPLKEVLDRLAKNSYAFVAGRIGISEEGDTNAERALLSRLTDKLDRDYKSGKPYFNGLEHELNDIFPGSQTVAKPL